MQNNLDPIHQFKVFHLIDLSFFGWDISFTNVSLFTLITIFTSSLFFVFTLSKRKLIPSRMQSIAEISYEFVALILRESAGSQAMKFFPLVFSLFIFILVANFIGLFPYFYTITSQIAITISLAVFVNLTIVVYGFFKNGFHFLKIFLPSKIPIVITPIVTIIEVISFLSRPISLSVRLFANILAGHITMKVFAGFVTLMIGSNSSFLIFGALLPLTMTTVITAVEFLVAFLQAYVFVVLTCMYLNNAVNPNH